MIHEKILKYLFFVPIILIEWDIQSFPLIFRFYPAVDSIEQ